MVEDSDFHTLFESAIGRIEQENGRKGWAWRAKGYGVEKFCQTHRPDWLPLDADGWLAVGPFKTERAALRDLEEFESEFQEFLQTEFRDLEIEDAPDPRTLS